MFALFSFGVRALVFGAAKRRHLYKRQAHAPSSQPQLCYIPDCGFEVEIVVGKTDNCGNGLHAVACVWNLEVDGSNGGRNVCNFMLTCN